MSRWPEREREAGRRQERRVWVPPRPPGAPPTQAPPQRPAHLGIGQHDVLDARWPAGLGALHAYVVDLVAADLAVLPAGRGRAPQHADGRGVERLRLHLPRRRAGHWRGQGRGGQGCYWGAWRCPRAAPLPDARVPSGCRLTWRSAHSPPAGRAGLLHGSHGPGAGRGPDAVPHLQMGN